MTWTLFSFLIALLLHQHIAFIQARDCTEDDITATYTSCNGNRRDLIWYYKENSNCTGGVPLPDNKFGLPCDIACGEGKYLPFGETSCLSCLEGTFSIGGGIRQSEWNSQTFPDYNGVFHYDVSCTAIVNGETIHIPCPDGWNVNRGILYSGSNITDDQASILELPIFLITTGHIHFQYKVDAEPRYDGLRFYINNELKLPLVSSTTDFLEYKQANLSAGYYIFKWVYAKDFSISQGEDGAIIKMIEIGGISFADNQCTKCSPSTYNDKIEQDDCLPCPSNTYSNTSGVITCSPCPSDEFAYPGSLSCSPRTNCSQTDYSAHYSECRAPGERTKYYSWNTPIYCDTNSFDLPENETVSCSPCNPGTSRDENFQCITCQKGYYSAGSDDTCHSCSAGSQAIRENYYRYFDSLFENSDTGCTGSCGTPGWRFLGTSMDSGVGHKVADSWFRLYVELETSGVLTFNYTLALNCLNCHLEVVDEGYTTQSYYYGNARSSSVALVPGPHSLIFNYHNADSSAGVNSRAIINSITITGTLSGGAGQCTACPFGSISSDLSSFCTPCPVGQTNNTLSTQCDNCPENTFNDRVGWVCVPCGPGTWSSPGANECSTDCVFRYNQNTVFDLTPLDKPTLYGPISSQGHTFYLNLCHREHTNQTCWNDQGEAMNTYGCQIHPGNGWAYDLGRVLGFYPYSKDPREGLVVRFSHGAFHDCERSTNITMICDPNAGTGTPLPKYPVEGPVCNYNFEWVSLYACPLCSSEDYTFQYSQCVDGKQRKIYYWKEDPKQCYGGVSLPENEETTCSESTIVCPPGSYLSPGATNCTTCEAGYFSFGGGAAFSNWPTLPEGFNSSCSGIDCQSWIPDLATIIGGKGKSILTYTTNFVKQGSLGFVYKLFVAGGASLNFYVDDKLTSSITTLNIYPSLINITDSISPGKHKFTWEFNNIRGAGRVSLYAVYVLGTSYSVPSCLACPPGSFSDPGASLCTRCPVNTHGIGASPTCIPCESRQYSFQGAHNCEEKPNCDSSHIEILYTPCNGNRRSSYPVLLDPPCILTDSFSLPSNKSNLECAPCPEGTYKEQGTGKCLTCSAGKVYDASFGTCIDVSSGFFAKRKQMYFIDNSLSTWPDNFFTGCSRNCGTRGWRIRGGYIDSGFQDYDVDHEIDSFVGATVNLVVAGSVSFVVTIPSSQTGEFEFFINGVLMETNYRIGDNYVKFALSKGSNLLQWNYHQSSDRTIAAVRSIIIEGTDTGISFAAACPPGTFTNSSGNSVCTPCPAGEYSPASQASQCDVCQLNTFQPKNSSSECYPCGEGGMTLSKGSAFCSTTCVFKATDSNDKTFTYDLTSIPSKVGPIPSSDGHQYYLSICGQLNDNVCRDENGVNIPTSVCSVKNNVGTDYGNSIEFYQNSDNAIDQGFLVRFAYGDAEGCLTHRYSTITFVCDLHSEQIGSPQAYAAQSCEPVSFLWHTPIACPVCQLEDFEEVVGECKGGKQSVIYVKKASCVGTPEGFVNHEVACSVSRAPIIGGVIAVVFIVVLLVIVVVLILRNRKTQRAYQTLQDEWSSKIEMTSQSTEN